MKYFAQLVSIVCLCVCAMPCLGGDAYPLRDAVECTARGGLPNFFAKLEKGQSVTIAYLGGSITAQPGWRVLSQKWFAKQYPKVKIKGIHAAIGGTGSSLGVYRLKRDALAHKPDLLFVEFAVNDAGAKPDSITKAMEGIVRQTWANNPNCDICYVYTITAKDTARLQAGKIKRSASVMESVADHYGIPSIHMGVEVANMEKLGKLIMKAQKGKMMQVSGDALNLTANLPKNSDGKIPFSRDGVHPYTDTGHQLYLNAITRSIPAIKAAGKIGPHALTKPLNPGNWQHAQMLPLSPSMFSGPVTLLKKDKELGRRFGKRMPGVWEAKPGASLTFKFKGSQAMVYDLLGPGCGMVEINIDGKVRKSRRMDRYCSYYRLAQLGVGKISNPNKVHTVKITVLEATFDKREVLFEQKRADFDKNPDKYAPLNWYPGAIMLVGELVNAQ
ncbi:MAG: SGNH/GDSL hydrolase family protein [Phycisphaeraceae bacterium]|nr:SGNH/GDSL hydrolase family protein [Phycisphaeraceae bacterium]